MCNILDADANLQGASSQLSLNIRRAADFLVGVGAPGSSEKKLSTKQPPNAREM